eukprot:s907_g4.t1
MKGRGKGRGRAKTEPKAQVEGEGGGTRGNLLGKRTSCPWINSQIIQASKEDNAIQRILGVVEMCIKDMNLVNLSTSLHRLAKLSVMTPHSDRMLRQDLYRPENIIGNDESSGNCYAKAFHTEGPDLADRCLEMVRKEFEKCNCLQGVQFTHAACGGTGTGLTGLVLKTLRDYLDKQSKCVMQSFVLAPAPGMSEVVLEPYNSALCFQDLLEYTDQVFLFDNRALTEVCQKALEQDMPRMTDLNQVVAKCMSGITSCLRYTGPLNADLRKLQSNLVPFKNAHFLISGLAPLTAKASEKYRKSSVLDIAQQMFSKDNVTVKCDPLNPGDEYHGILKARFLASWASWRGDYQTKEVDKVLYDFQKDGSRYDKFFPDWIPNSIASNICKPKGKDKDIAVIRDERDASVVFTSNNTAVHEVFDRCIKVWDSVYKSRAYVHVFEQDGIAVHDLVESRQASPVMKLLLASIATAFCAVEEDPSLPQSLSNITWSLATLRIVDYKVLEMAGTLAIANMKDFKAFELASLLWSFAKLGCADTMTPVVSPLFRAATGRLMACMNGAGFRSLATAAWAFATARQASQRLFRAIAKEVQTCLPTANSQELANIVWAYGTVGHRDDQLFRIIAEECVRRLDEFKTQELSNTFWGFASNDFHHEAFYQKALLIAQGMQLQPQHVANILWAAARLHRKHPAARQAALHMVPACLGFLTSFKPQEVASTAHAVAKIFSAEADGLEFHTQPMIPCALCYALFRLGNLVVSEHFPAVGGAILEPELRRLYRDALEGADTYRNTSQGVATTPGPKEAKESPKEQELHPKRKAQPPEVPAEEVKQEIEELPNYSPDRTPEETAALEEEAERKPKKESTPEEGDHKREDERESDTPVLLRPAGVLGRGLPKAKAKAKPKAVAKGGAKAKSRPLRVRLKRPSAELEEEDLGERDISGVFQRGDEVEAGTVPQAEWRSGQRIVITRGLYWEEPVTLSGVIQGILHEEDETTLRIVVEGSQSESLVKWAGLNPSRRMEVHLCGKECPRMSRDGLVHALKLRLLTPDHKAGWMDNLLEVRRVPEGGGDVKRKGRSTSARRRSPRRKERRGSRRRGLVRITREEGEEEEDQAEEGRQGEDQDQWDQTPRSGVWQYGHGSKAREEEGNSKAGKESGEEKEQEGIIIIEQQSDVLPWERQLLGGGREALWRGGQSENPVEEVSRVPHSGNHRAHADDGGEPDGSAMGGRSSSSTSDIYPVLADDPTAEDGRRHGARSANSLLSSGPSHSRSHCSKLRCDHTAIEGIGGNCGRSSLLRSSTSGARTIRDDGDEHTHGVSRGLQAPEGGATGSNSQCSALGAQNRLGQEARGFERKGTRERTERQGQRKGRSASRASKGRQGQGQEVAHERWEFKDSETLRGGFEGPVMGLPEAGWAGMVTSDTPMPAFPGTGLFPEGAPEPTGAGRPFFTTEGRTFADLINHILSMFSRFDSDLNSPCSKIQNSGGLFPLPDTPSGLVSVVGHLPGDSLAVLCGMCKALNSYYGVRAAERALLSEASRIALRALSSYATDSGLTGEKFEGVRWEQFLATRGVDYRGEEVKLARRFTWSNIEPALPKGIGCIPLEEVCGGGTLDFVVNFERYLLPVEDMVYTRPPRIFVEPDEWEQVCSGLLSTGICRLLPLSEVFHLNDRPIHNGLFGVSKDEFIDGVEIHRLIMNLVPANKLVRNLGGDISTLPSVVGMAPILMEDHEVLVMSSEDIRCFFYLFSVPVVWHKFLSFGREVPASVAPPGATEPYFLASRVLPMGFASSVSIAQHVHRRVVRLALHGMQPHHPTGQCELRKDRVFPSSKWLYRIYLDNFDTLERMDVEFAGLVAGKPSVETLAVRQGYLQWGMPRHPKKSVEQELHAEIQGALVDGRSGKVRPKPQKVLKYVELAWQVLQAGKANQKQMQVVCGGLVYCSMFRRAMLGMLNQVWRFVTSFEGDPPVVKRALPPGVQMELMRFILAIPLAQMNLRSPVRGDVTVSDASEMGGGFCTSDGLTPMGVHAACCHVRGDLPDLDDHVQVLTIGLFDGIGALRVGCDVLKLPMAGHVSSEVSKEGNRVLASQFPDTIQVGDVTQISDEMVQQWAATFSNVGVVLVGGGPPCQGVSGLNSDRKGALKDARSSLFVHVRRVYRKCKKFFPWAQVRFFMESVFSMDAADRATMSEHMGVEPYMVEAHDVAVCRRPRLYWISWELQECEDVAIEHHPGSGWESYSVVRLRSVVDRSLYFVRGWETVNSEPLPTFTTSRPRDHPGNRPAGLKLCTAWEVERWRQDRHRYPPYVYRDKHCLQNNQGDKRLPNISEKEAAMGFPVGYTEGCLPKGQQKGEGYADVRHTLIGNSWCVPVISWFLKELFYPLGLTSLASVQEVVKASSPGQDSQLQAYLRRPPLNPIVGSQHMVAETVLTKKLMQFVSVKGEDLLIQADTENQVKYHRLRSSVPSRTREERVVQRKKLGSLRSLTVQPSTKKRYDLALDRFLEFLRKEGISLPTKREALDDLAAEYLEFLWSSGEGRALASDTLASLQNLEPHLKGHLCMSWRLLKVWHQNELPSRAPPFPEIVLQALVGKAIMNQDSAFALSLLLGFYGMMRTGEILSLEPKHVEASHDNGPAIISLGLTKAGKRQGAAESITLSVSDVVRRLRSWKASSRKPLVASASQWRAEFSQSLADLALSDFQFRPYSLRRGGYRFQCFSAQLHQLVWFRENPFLAMTRGLQQACLFLLGLTLAWADDCDVEAEPTSLLQALKGSGVPYFRGTAKETKEHHMDVLKGPAGLFPYNLMTCQGEQTVSTKGMTSAKYDEVLNKVMELYNRLDSTCEAENCPRAEWSGCVLRIAGHDFMDYNPQTHTGGANGCIDLSDPDNGGLAECLYTGAEFGISIADAYEFFCTEVSLADFIVIAAHAIIQKTRQNVLDKDPHAPSINLKDIFKWGRDTATACPEAHGVMPNPEESCGAVEKVFVKNMGLNWRRAAALMGVHTLGRCRIENSGYDGWWSNVWNSQLFNNNYYIAMAAKGWVVQKAVNGNRKKNQWVLGDYEKKKEGRRGHQMMLNTDLCLAFSNDRKGQVDLNAKTAERYGCRCAWMGPLEAKSAWEKYNKGKFCGTKYVPDDYPVWSSQREICCGMYDPYGGHTDCGRPQRPRGRAWGDVRSFMGNEGEWLKVFKEAWIISINNGFEGKLKNLQ